MLRRHVRPVLAAATTACAVAVSATSDKTATRTTLASAASDKNSTPTTLASAASDKNSAPATLYASWFCPYAQRVWIALEEKEIHYNYVEINPYEDGLLPGSFTKKALSIETKRRRYPEFVAASPRGLVPALVCGDEAGSAVCDSAVVLEFLEEQFPQSPAMLPGSPTERAHVRYWCVFAQEKIIPFYYRMLMSRDEKGREAAKNQIIAGLTTFAQACDPAGPYFMGEQFGTADLWLFPWYDRLLTVGAAYRGFEVPKTAEFARLDAWYSAVRARPAVASTLADREKLIENYSGYSDNSATSDAAVRFRGS